MVGKQAEITPRETSREVQMTVPFMAPEEMSTLVWVY